MNDYEGTAVGAPRTVDIDRQDRLPMLWAVRASGLRDWQVQRLRNSAVVVADLVSGRISVHDTNFGPKKVDFRNVPLSSHGSPPDPDTAEGATAITTMLDLRTVANLPWRPGHIAATVLIHDWVSNTVVIRLARPGEEEPETSAPRIPTAAANDLEQQIRRIAESQWPERTFEVSEQTPTLEGPGIVVVAPTTLTATDDRWMIHGAAKLRLAPGMIVDLPGDAGATSRGSSIPSAVVTVLLMISRLDEPVPRTVSVQIPVYSSASRPAPGDVADLAFALDLKSALAGALPSGIYFLSAAGGEYVSVPRRIVVL